MTPAEKKMAFVSVFFSFALALFILNSEKKRITFNCIQQFSVLKALILVVNGFVGGVQILNLIGQVLEASGHTMLDKCLTVLTIC